MLILVSGNDGIPRINAGLWYHGEDGFCIIQAATRSKEANEMISQHSDGFKTMSKHEAAHVHPTFRIPLFIAHPKKVIKGIPGDYGVSIIWCKLYSSAVQRPYWPRGRRWWWWWPHGDDQEEAAWGMARVKDSRLNQHRLLLLLGRISTSSCSWLFLMRCWRSGSGSGNGNGSGHSSTSDLFFWEGEHHHIVIVVVCCGVCAFSIWSDWWDTYIHTDTYIHDSYTVHTHYSHTNNCQCVSALPKHKYLHSYSHTYIHT